jgi:transposase
MEPMTRHTPEMRERVPRMLAEPLPHHPNLTLATRQVAGTLGISPETLRLWRRHVEANAGGKVANVSDAAAQIKRLKREVAELRRANEMLKAASAFFAKELDRS